MAVTYSFSTPDSWTPYATALIGDQAAVEAWLRARLRSEIVDQEVSQKGDELSAEKQAELDAYAISLDTELGP
jgi:hypothetical protein